MKGLFLVTVFVLLAVTYAVNISPELKAKIQKAHKECVKETGVDENVAKKTREGIFPEDDPKLKQHLLCFSKKFNLINDAGVINTEEIKKEAGNNLTAEQLNNIVTHCINQKATADETAFHLWKCWRQHVPPVPLE